MQFFAKRDSWDGERIFLATFVVIKCMEETRSLRQLRALSNQYLPGKKSSFKLITQNAIGLTFDVYLACLRSGPLAAQASVHLENTVIREDLKQIFGTDLPFVTQRNECELRLAGLHMTRY